MELQNKNLNRKVYNKEGGKASARWWKHVLKS